MSPSAALVHWANGHGVQLLASVAVWATLVLSVAWLAARSLRRSSSALRYCVWQLGLSGLIVLPFLYALLPGIPLGFSLAADSQPAAVEDPPIEGPAAVDVNSAEPLPGGESNEARAAVASDTTDIPSRALEPAEPADDSPPSDDGLPRAGRTSAARLGKAADRSAKIARAVDAPIGAAQSRPAKFRPRWPLLLVAAWLLGVAANLAWLACAALRVRQLLRGAEALDAARFDQIRQELQPPGDNRPVCLITTPELQVPAVVGLLRPRILLPADCAAWSAERIRIVLAHELAHIERQDIFWQLVARASAALYWFHPLVWLALRRMRDERERSCDDRVLSAGVQPTDYADLLVDVAATLIGNETFAVGGIGMASRSPLESRLRSILDRSTCRTTVSRGVRRGLFAGTATVIVALGLLRPFGPLTSSAVGPPDPPQPNIDAQNLQQQNTDAQNTPAQNGQPQNPQLPAAAAFPAAQLLPATTKGYLSIDRVDRFRTAWATTELGQLLADPIMQPFVADFRRQLKDEWSPLDERLGIDWEDLFDVASGELALAVVQPERNEAGLVVIADVTGRRGQTAKLLAKVDTNLTTRHQAVASVFDLAGTAVTLYAMPPGKRYPARRAYLCVKQDRLIATDRPEVLEGILGRFAPGAGDSLAGLPAFQSVMARCQKAAGAQVPHVRWFVEPFGYAQASRVANPPVRHAPDLLKILGDTGFTAIQGLGGYVHLATDRFDVWHQTAVYAPPTNLGENRYQSSAAMLDFPNGGRQLPEPWVPRDVATHTSFNFAPRKAFESSKDLVDALVGDETFEDVVTSIKDDPNGPRLDLRADLVGLLVGRATIVTDYPLPSTPHSERLLVAIRTSDDRALAANIDKSMQTEPGAKRHEYREHVIWEIINADTAVAGNEADEKENETGTRLLPDSVVTVAHGQLLIASHFDFLIRMLDQLDEGQQLAASSEYRSVKAELDRLSGGKACAQTFSHTDEELRSPYELIRAGRMPEAETVLGKLLNALCADPDSRLPRSQRIDGQHLPQYDAVRRYFGPAGWTAVSEDDGWFLTGFTLAQAERPAPAKPSTAAAAPPADNPADKTAQQKTSVPAAPKANQPKEVATTGTMHISVVDSAGKPIPAARIFRSGVADGVANGHYVCDANGQIDVAIPKTLQLLRIWARSDGYIPLFAQWWPEKQEDGHLIPAAFTFAMQKGTAIGGIVNDAQGQPIAGVHVEVKYDHRPGNTGLTSRPVFDNWLAEGDTARITDAAGRWTLDNVPPGDDVTLSVKLTHPDYVSDMGWGDLQEKQHVTLAMLRAQTATLVIERGVSITGTLTDPDGKPVAGAVVVWGDHPYSEHRPQQEVRSDENGLYRFPPLPAGPMTVTVMARGWMPELRIVNVAAEMPPVDFRLKPGKTLRIRFTDPAGNPIPQVFVSIHHWRGKESLYNYQHPNVLDTGIPVVAVDGLYEWTWAPDDAVTYRLAPLGPFRDRLSESEATLTADDQDHVHVFQPLLHIAGSVTDAETGRPIDRFTIIPVRDLGPNGAHVNRGQAKEYSAGQFAVDLRRRPNAGHRLRIEAEGYRTAMSDAYRLGQPDPTVDFRLEPATPAVGRVFSPDGKPVAGAKVYLATKTQSAQIMGREIGAEEQNLSAISDRHGAFSFPAQLERYAVIATHDDGYAEVVRQPDQSPGELKLAPWARLDGRLLEAGKPVAGVRVLLAPLRPRVGEYCAVEAMISPKTDEAGRFVFERVAPVKSMLWTNRQNPGVTYSGLVPLDVKPGQHLTQDLGGDGATVRGRVVLTGAKTDDVDLTHARVWLVRKAFGIDPPEAIAGMKFDWADGWNDSWDDTPEGQAYLQTLHHYDLHLAADGSFLVSGLPAGEYCLAARVYHHREGEKSVPSPTRVVQVKVADDDVAHAALDLGTIEIAP